MLPHQTAAPTAESQPVPRPTAAPTAEPHPVPHPTSIRIVVTNEYGGQPLSIGRGMYPNISAVVEPFRYSNMTLHHAGELAGPVVWSVHDATSDTTVVDAVVTTSSSHAIAHEFTDPSHVYVISAVDRASGSATALRVTCKYVRRELHTLTADDRERYLAALATVYHTREAEGKQQFGDRFTSGEWFARWHLGESGVPSTGQNTAWHSAPSFFTAHASLVLMMERSLQSIDPRVAAHYWDYTIDSELYGASDGGDWSGTFYFSDEWFGPMPGASASANNDMAVGEIRGRFAGIEIERNFSQPTHNSYGLLTGPYNNNDARVLTRALSVCGMPTTNIPLPGCQALLATFKQGTMSDFDIHSEAALHAMLHVLFGGAWGCKEDLRSFAAVHPAIAKALGDFVHFYNGMLMVSTSTEELTCPGYCSEDTPFDNCLCSCPFLDHSSVNLTRFTQHHLELARDASREARSSLGAEDGGVTEEDMAERREVQRLFREKLIEPLVQRHGAAYIESAFAFDEATSSWNFRALQSLSNATDRYRSFESLLESLGIALMCNPGKLSQFMSPFGSANDPLFWPIHTTFERNWAYMRTFRHLNSTWGEHPSSNGISLTSWGFHAPLEPFGRRGHRLFDGVDPPGGDHRSFTNAELVELFDPQAAHLTHIWDDVAWDHCADAEGTYTLAPTSVPAGPP